MTITDPLLKWHEALVVAGLEVEHFITNPQVSQFSVYGTIDKRRIALWRGFNDQVNVVVDAARAEPRLLVQAAQKSPSGGVTAMTWMRVEWLTGYWYFGWFLRDTVGFIQTLSLIRAVAHGRMQPADKANDRMLQSMTDHWSIARQQRLGDPPEEWLSAARTPESPRRP